MTCAGNRSRGGPGGAAPRFVSAAARWVYWGMSEISQDPAFAAGERPALKTLLASLDRYQPQALVESVATSHPKLVEEIAEKVR